jgi:hypothetical protein
MNRFIAVIALACSTATLARADHISVFEDPTGYDCSLNQLVEPPALNSFYTVHKYNAGSTASQFKVNVDASGLFPHSFTSPYLILGSWPDGVSIGYGGCVAGDHVLMTLNFLWFGEPTTCENMLIVVPSPTSPVPGEVAVARCGDPIVVVGATGGHAYVGPESDTCPCLCQCPHPVHETTWGGVKALYR